MCDCCFIIPADVLKRLSEDRSLSNAARKNFADSITIDVQVRKLREQARKLTSTTLGIAGPMTIAAAPVVTVYDCQHGQNLPGTPVPSPGTSADPDAKQTYEVTAAVAAFYEQVFGRNSIDNAGMTMMSSIHYGANYNNAFWNGSQMTYGDGDGSIFIDFCKGNDVACHELTHGVTQYTLQLSYTGDSGGLNEGNSDVFGTMFRQWQAGQDVTQADWLIGSDIMGPGAKAKGYTCLRDLSQPDAKHCLAPQPTQYSQVTPGMDPHYSSGIPNFAFYKMATYLGGKSWERAGQVWYKTLTGLGPSPNLKMKAFAAKMRGFAKQMYPNEETTFQAIDRAWTEVGL
jgi:Zn-dependent metalloprotease